MPKGIADIGLGAHVVPIGLAGTLRQGLLLFVLASLFAHLKFPLIVNSTGMLDRFHRVVGAKSFPSSLPIPALFPLCSSSSILQFGLFFVDSMHPFKQACSHRLFL